MKCPAAAATASCLALAAASSVAPARQHRGSLALLATPKGDDGLLHYGDTKCPCIGFDNLRGTTPIDLDDKTVVFPADLGSRCESWDDGRHPACKEGQTPGFGNDWCGQQWCFVDPCNCDIPVMPKMSTYLPDVMYRGKPLYYSYATCGGEDTFSKERPEIGDAGCRCIGFDNMPGQTEVLIQGLDGAPDRKALYPSELGGTCRAWDAKIHPECRGDKAPSWCRARWCYVDPCSCNLKTPPKVTSYLPEATFTGKSLYYSYETCGDEDTFTKTHNVGACVNQDTQRKCRAQKRPDGSAKCAWSDGTCLGSELVNHPLCEKLVKKKTTHVHSGAEAAHGFAAAAAAVAAAAACLA